MTRQKSRPARWADACTNLRTAMEEITSQLETVSDALAELKEIQGEYEDWFDNLPEGLQDGPTGALLAEITNLDIPEEATLDTLDDINTLTDEAEGMELPRGFGRD